MSKYFVFIPNLLSLTRIALLYPIFNNIYLNNFKLSIIFFIVASLTDALDGFLARRMNWQTQLGTILDPVADKLLLSGAIFIFWINNYIPLYIFVIFISRDVVILLGAAIKMSLMESNTPLPNLLGKLTTTLQIIYICIIFVMEIFNINFPLIVIDILIVAITALSLLVYSYKWFRDLKVFHNE
ncbi:MAG: CDP-diacylglycerol--glycerol-3-phosphate 3-phosphatidyltransferase [Gammaproteobacteria bacterium]|nr:CDP-diacylglycerol--glycerol-3-phosphate 3-phosphatidyltransferase [Gammaproteobacteria bacterium]|tara:strand:- start:535 stop:1086 length:552 start_codon:yes stop_codon:yes gene_type:complete